MGLERLAVVVQDVDSLFTCRYQQGSFSTEYVLFLIKNTRKTMKPMFLFVLLQTILSPVRS